MPLFLCFFIWIFIPPERRNAACSLVLLTPLQETDEDEEKEEEAV